MTKNFVNFVREIYSTDEYIPLHIPSFFKEDEEYVNNAIKSTYVSSAGEYVDLLEHQISQYTGSKVAVATSNGTSALHLALEVAGVGENQLVITPSFTFVATSNAITYSRARPLFVDVSKESLGLCPNATIKFLEENAELINGNCIHKDSNKRIRAIIVMHTFGHPVDLDKFLSIAKDWNLILIEDAAESLGSFYKNIHTGTFGDYGAISFNGNKIITTGGGGMLLCKDVKKGRLAKHLSTTAKSRPDDFFHDVKGYNYRMPNLNAALGCSQFKKLSTFIKLKRDLALEYKDFFKNSNFMFFEEPEYAKSNYWLNTILANDKATRDEFIETSNKMGINCRPAWYPNHKLPMYQNDYTSSMENTEYLWERVINLPSTPIKI